MDAEIGGLTMYDELVKRLRLCAEGFRCRECDYGNVRLCRLKMNNEAADAIEELIRRCEQFQYMPLPAWVPVTEKLPDHGWYLAYGPTIKMEVLHFHCAEEVWSSERYYNLEVTHWMPLPPPPKDKT